jgi:hypothetical protein
VLSRALFALLLLLLALLQATFLPALGLSSVIQISRSFSC